MFPRSLSLTFGAAAVVFAMSTGAPRANAGSPDSGNLPAPAQPGTLTGGATIDRVSDVLTPAQQAQVQQKLAAQQAFLSPPGFAGLQER
jgi:hypothetical protein